MIKYVFVLLSKVLHAMIKYVFVLLLHAMIKYVFALLSEVLLAIIKYVFVLPLHAIIKYVFCINKLSTACYDQICFCITIACYYQICFCPHQHAFRNMTCFRPVATLPHQSIKKPKITPIQHPVTTTCDDWQELGVCLNKGC